MIEFGGSRCSRLLTGTRENQRVLSHKPVKTIRLTSLLLLLLLGSSAWAGPIVTMLYVTESAPGADVFSVDGVLKQLFCDQVFPNATTGYYKATVMTLADLTGTTLAIQGDP